MIRLDSTTRVLKANLLAGIATTNPDVVVCFVDKRNASKPGEEKGILARPMAGTSDVVICTAPENLVVRDIDSICVRNNDTAAVTWRLSYYDGATQYRLVTVTIPTLETLQYESGLGWRVITASGQVRQ